MSVDREMFWGCPSRRGGRGDAAGCIHFIIQNSRANLSSHWLSARVLFAEQLMDGDVERSAAVEGGADSSDARPHINPAGYPLGLIASVATGVFGGASHPPFRSWKPMTYQLLSLAFRLLRVSGGVVSV